MKRVKIAYLCIGIIILTAACSGTRHSADRATSNQAEKPNNEPGSTAPVSETGSNRERVEGREIWLGSEIVSESVGRLSTKLLTDNVTTDKFNVILKSSFAAIGGELKKSYSISEAREMAKKIIRNSESKINEILNDNQRAAFKQILLN